MRLGGSTTQASAGASAPAVSTGSSPSSSAAATAASSRPAPSRTRGAGRARPAATRQKVTLMPATAASGPGRAGRAEPVRVGHGAHALAHARVEEVVVGQVLGVDGEPLAQRVAGLGAELAEPADLGPGRLGVDEVGGEGGDPAPVVDPGQQQRPVVGRQVRRGLDAHRRPHHQARDRAGAHQLHQARARRPRPSGCRAWRGSSGRSPPGCGRARSCSSRSASSASTRSRGVSPIPIRIPEVKGMRSSPARRIIARRVAGRLSGACSWGPPGPQQALGDRLQHHPLARRDLAQLGQLAAARARRRWGGAAGRSPRAPSGTSPPGRSGWSRGRSGAARGGGPRGGPRAGRPG